MLFMIMKYEINKLICILFVQFSSIIPENSKALALIILEILEFIDPRSYKFGLVNSLFVAHINLVTQDSIRGFPFRKRTRLSDLIVVTVIYNPDLSISLIRYQNRVQCH